MKICFISTSNSWHMDTITRYFAEKGHDISYIGTPTDVKYDVDYGKVKVYDIVPSMSKNMLLRLYHHKKQVASLLDKIKPDIVNAVGMNPALLARAAGYRPLVITPLGSGVIVLPQKIKAIKYLYRWIFSSCDGVWQDSDVCREAALKCGAPIQNNVIVGWGVNLTKFNRNLDGSIIRRRYGVENRPVVFSPRGFSQIYNIETVIKSIPVVKKVYPDIVFIFCYHYTEKESEIKHLVSELQVQENVILAGYVDYNEMPLYMAASDVMVSVPYSDSSPRSVYEAMASGIPVVVSRLPWYKGKLIEDIHISAVEKDSEDELAEKVVSLISDSEKKNRIIENAYHWVSENLDNASHMNKLEQFLKEIVRSRSKQFGDANVNV